jgi:dTDP-L-rhamnose 4-epimerase
MKTILITGGLGFIGLNLAEQLVGTGVRVRLLDNLSAQIHGALPVVSHRVLGSASVEVMRGDVSARADLVRAIAEVDAIVHLAAETGTAQSMYEIAHYNQVNVQATALLLDVLQREKHAVRKILLASSRSVYGEGAFVCRSCSPETMRYPDSRMRGQLAAHQWDPLCPACGAAMSPVATPEHARIYPASIYAATKFAQEELIRIGAQAQGIASVVLRLQNVYGEGQSLNNPYTGILSIFSTRIRQNKTLPIFEDGLESRDFVHVSDVARAFVAALNRDVGLFEVFNVGAGEAVTVMDVATKLSSKLGGTIAPHTTAEYRLGDIRHCYADITNARELLGYEPKVRLEEGIPLLLGWVREQTAVDRVETAAGELESRGLVR